MSTTTCLTCGFQPPAGDVFCLNCGSLMAATKHPFADAEGYAGQMIALFAGNSAQPATSEGDQKCAQPATPPARSFHWGATGTLEECVGYAHRFEAGKEPAYHHLEGTADQVLADLHAILHGEK